MSDTREKQMIEAFVELADTLVEDFDVIDFLHSLTGRCLELLRVQAAGVVLGDQRGKLRFAAASTEEARLLELLELQTEAGPCVDCFRTGRAVVNADLATRQDRWPRFAAAAENAGFLAVHALPLRLRGEVIGAVNLFCAEPSTLDDDDIRVGQALADVATIGIIQHRGIRHAEILTDQLQTALNSRVIIEQAKGMLAERGELAMDAAFELLRGHARRTNQRLSDLAHAVIRGTVAADELLGSSTESAH